MAQIEILRAKIHRATVTDCLIDYCGSLTIDPQLMEAVGIFPYEKIEVANITNGNRFTTYAITGKPGDMIVNGAAARLAAKGDTIIVMAYARIDDAEAAGFKPKVAIMAPGNEIKELRT